MAMKVKTKKNYFWHDKQEERKNILAQKITTIFPFIFYKPKKENSSVLSLLKTSDFNNTSSSFHH